jgi:hypothetical protein
MALPAQPTSPPDDQRGNDPLSPTTLIYNYLRQQGLPPTSENVSRALQANAANPGVIKSTDYNMPAQPMPIAMINDLPVDSPRPSGGGTKRSSAPPSPRWDIPQDDSWDLRGGVKPPPDSFSPLRNIGTPNGGGGLLDMILGNRPPSPSPVGVPSVPQISPPPASASVALPPPPNPMEAAMNRAVPPQLPAPSPQLALPAPPTPQRPAIAAPPEVPRIVGQSARPALPPPAPNIGQPNLGPAPGKQVQGAPIEQTPLTRALPRAATGAASGYARGGVPGAVAGGLSGVAPELIPYIMKNLHLF